MKIILDTNFVVYCAKQKIDYAEEIGSLVKGKYELYIPSEAIMELLGLKENAKKFTDKQAAELALKMLKTNKINILDINGNGADEAIIKHVKRYPRDIVATIDKKLSLKLKKVIIIRSKKKLSFR